MVEVQSTYKDAVDAQVSVFKFAHSYACSVVSVEQDQDGQRWLDTFERLVADIKGAAAVEVFNG